MAVTLTPGTWSLDTVHSEIGMTVRHAGVSRLRAQFDEATSSLEVTEDGTAEVNASITAASFNSRNEDRDAHIRSADFLDVENYPELTFVASDIRPAGETFELTGALTIRGVTQDVTLETEFGGEAVDPFGATRAGFSASGVISRKAFGLNWNAALEAGGVLVGDKVSLDLELAFVLQES